MDEQTKKYIYEIIEQGKILEALMKELELEPTLTDKPTICIPILHISEMLHQKYGDPFHAIAHI